MVGVFLAGYRHFRLFLIEAGNSLTDYLHRTREACILLDGLPNFRQFFRETCCFLGGLSNYCPYRHALFFLRRDALAGMGEVRFYAGDLAHAICIIVVPGAVMPGEVPP